MSTALKNDGNCHIEHFTGFGIVISNILLYAVSALYHAGGGWWPSNIEIVLQKLDHCCIALFTTAAILPSAAHLLDDYPILQFVQLCLLIYLCLLTFIRIYQCKPSVQRQLAVAGAFVPFLPLLLSKYSSFEFYTLLFGHVCNFTGVYFFVKQIPKSDWFGYHGKLTLFVFNDDYIVLLLEVFHAFTVIGSTCAYFHNWSIIHRSCHGLT